MEAAQTRSSAAAAPASSHSTPPPPPDVTSDDEAKVAAERSMYPDQDDVQAVLQPAMSRAASHLTSIHTPAVEKVAAMERMTGFFDGPVVASVAEDSNDDEAAPAGTTTGTTAPAAAATPTKRPSTPKTVAAPAPADRIKTSPPSMPKPFNSQDVYKTTRTQTSKGVLGAALGPTRHQRSGSAGQEALKRFRGVLPSFGSSSSFLPSLPTKYFNNLADSIPSISIGGGHGKNAKSETAAGAPVDAPAAKRLQGQATMPVSTAPPRESADSARLQPRPGSLRRTTSDESILYHTLSRQSSLGDDDRFQDVREMVNMRLLAFKDSLPDVPNFKMPTLARLQATARRSQLSLNGIFSSDSAADAPSSSSREAPEPGTTGGAGVASHQQQHEPKLSSSPPPPPPPSSKDDFEDMLHDLVGDVVILGGYRGSVLRSAEPPHHQLWAPVKLGLNLRKADLEVGLTDADEETMPERIIPSGMLKKIGPIDVSRKLFRKLQASPHAQAGRLRVWDFGYDWRLSPRRLSRHLQDFLATLPCNQPPSTSTSSRGAIVIAHSLGGLITRHAVNQRPDLFAGVLYAGAPQQCMNILGPLRNGDAVLFNEKLLTARVNFSIRTSFALLPEDSFCFVDKRTGEPYPVDFLDPMSWVRYRLSPCLEAPLPPLSGSGGGSSSSNGSSALAAFLPQAFLRPRSDSKGGDRKENQIDPLVPSMTSGASSSTPVTTTTTTVAAAGAPDSSDASPPDSAAAITEEAWLATADEERRRNYAYLKRTLADTRRFRAEMRHDERHQAANAYPPLAVLYGKAIPTVCAAGVDGRAGIARADAYDDLVFRSGDGVTLAREAMLPPGYALVRGGRVSTERGHITMLGDMPALGRALKALVRGRAKGIGLGIGDRRAAAAAGGSAARRQDSP
ncbi:hypothetical protein V2A60_008915 [Cordyceps javanica]